MVHSMTAFSRSEQAGPHGTLSWEIRSVNHRYLEPHLRLPEAFRDLEGPLREALRKGLSRGKVECTLRFAEEKAGSTLKVDAERARQLIEAAQSIAELIDNPAPLSPLEVLAWPGVLAADAADPQALNRSALQLFGEALEQLRQGRQREGEELARLIDERLEGILEQEMVLLAQKSDVAEELDRLATHVGEVRRVLAAGGAAGRRLDFLMQELNREANALGSKSFDPRSTQAAVNLKVLIEQMREQVQNIE